MSEFTISPRTYLLLVISPVRQPSKVGTFSSLEASCIRFVNGFYSSLIVIDPLSLFIYVRRLFE